MTDQIFQGVVHINFLIVLLGYDLFLFCSIETSSCQKHALSFRFAFFKGFFCFLYLLAIWCRLLLRFKVRLIWLFIKWIASFLAVKKKSLRGLIAGKKTDFLMGLVKCMVFTIFCLLLNHWFSIWDRFSVDRYDWRRFFLFWSSSCFCFEAFEYNNLRINLKVYLV